MTEEINYTTNDGESVTIYLEYTEKLLYERLKEIESLRISIKQQENSLENVLDIENTIIRPTAISSFDFECQTSKTRDIKEMITIRLAILKEELKDLEHNFITLYKYRTINKI